MGPEQKAAYIIAQSVCAMAEIAAMQAQDRIQGQKYAGNDYLAVIEKYGIHHNAVIAFLE